METSTETEYLTRKQVAAMLNMSESWLANRGRKTGPKFYLFGNAARYHINDVRAWAKQQVANR